MEDILIKEALPEDAEKLIAYSKKIGSETDNLSFGKEGFTVTVENEAEYIKSIHADMHSVLYLAWKDNEIVGSGSLNGFLRRMNHRAELGLTVAKAEWDKGIGSALLTHLINYAKQNGIEIINLEVRSDNLRAIRIYKKFGFKRIGVSPSYFKINDEYVDFDLMYLDLR